MTHVWPIRTLGEICSFENGDRGTNYPSKSVQTTSGIPFINAGHLSSNGVDYRAMNYIPRERFEQLGSGKIRPGDILFCLRGSLGKFASVGELSEGAIASSLIIVRPRELVLDRYILAYFQSDLCSKMIDKFKNGAAQPNLSGGSLKKFIIPVPPLDEQQRIVDILDEAFDGIARGISNVKKILQNARSVFQTVLQIAFTQQGEGWEEKSLGEIAKIKGGKRVPKGYRLLDEPTDFPYLRVTDFNDAGSIDLEDLRYVSAEVHRGIKNYVIFSRDLYISIAGTVGKTGIIPEELDGAHLTENACRLIFRPNISNRFVYYFTKSADFMEQIGLNTRTAAQPKLALSRLSSIKLRVPNPSVQELLVEKLDALKEEIQRLESTYHRKLSALEELKKSLLHQAFNGEL